MTEQRPAVAIYFRMFSPYILARINGAAARLSVVGIEGSRRSTVYAWEPRLGEERFARRTLFSDAPIEDKPAAEMVRAVRAALDAADPAVVCVTGWSHSEALAMLLWARARDRPVVMLSESTAHDATRSFLREAIKRHIVGLCDAALVGGAPQRRYVEALGMAPDRVFIGYDAVDNDFFARGAAAARANAAAMRATLGLPERYFLASCRFIAKKNLTRLIDAFASYRATVTEDAWDLVLIGDGALRAELEAQAAARGIADAVRFMGFRQYDDLPAFYGLAGGFVHISTVEQWGLVVNEAMAAGLPVIVSRACGCAEDLVDHGVNGWTVDPLDDADIAQRLIDLAAPATDRDAMGAAASRIVADFGPARFGAGVAAAVERARGGPVRRAGPLSRWLLSRLAARNTRDGG
ncbi:glycosyltransferase family 4 protein [Sphingomonas sp. AR_OL41]|uniref:glycosyltransferase family 4 protein n=1 Tax=Sphingomonas sp. AR_OL41 TaxID=3042729 RepID=UPI002481198F|nr:glycosyltransferase family 4 protein [Sphingomonas sp. AR_OL41]MDH7974648.1 glycosyltransferase family 4 protein [Sphingomonas sp. AR_OL41]